MNKKKTDRSQKKRNLSVVPVTSRQTTGTTQRHINIRAALKEESRRAWRKMMQCKTRWQRCEAAITALGSLKQKETK